MYGKKYISDYKPFLKRLFEKGEQDEALKMSPSRMLQSIKEDAIFSLRLDHPSETEIRSYISSLLQSVKRKRNIQPEADERSSRARINFDVEELDQ